MGVHRYRPTTPDRCGTSVSDFVEITRSKPEKLLPRPLHKTDGRNPNGRVTAYHRGGGHKCQYRVTDLRRHDKNGASAVVTRIEYDPNRTARIALLHYTDGGKRYILAPAKLSQGDRIEAGVGADIKPGNNLPLHNIPLGTVMYAVELKPGGGAKITRSAGPPVQFIAREGCFTQLRMPFGEIRNVEITCRATVGGAGDAEQSNINWGKAGRMRWKGKRPHVRGTITNPVGHPHGGDEGRASGGRRPVGPWDKPRGRTRRPSKDSGRLIVRRHKTDKDR